MPNTKIVKVGLFVDYLGFLQATENLPLVDYYYLTAEDTRDQEWARKFLPAEKIITYKIGGKYGYFHNYFTDRIIRDSNLTEVLKQNEISVLVPGFDCSRFVFGWAAKNNLKIASIDHRFQHNFENKIYFDKFLQANGFPKPKSFITQLPLTSSLPFSDRFVLQASASRGGTGTFFLESAEQIDNLIKTKVLETKTDYLLREFISGKTYGISVFVGQDFLALSAARQQCFFDLDQRHNKVFRGVQWVGNSFSDNLKEKVNENFSRIGKLLLGKGYFGFANFDFMIDEKESLYFIEFNPRLSSATPQIFLNPELLSGLPLGQIFLEKFLETKTFIPESNFYPYPETDFEGSLLDVVVKSPDKKKHLIEKEYTNGIYSLKQNSFVFENPDIRKIKGDNFLKKIIFYSDVRRGESYGDRAVVFHLFSTYRLFRQDGTLNEEGEKALAAFKYKS
ncbi:MAG: carbamoyl phosphate synthase-like protein [Microgenomates group bacterium ADurb.Bin219]|nr:MAG: carbamoyl phosphate synthase-like protein [Microgenomates group bacterium ADurb.Bin219]HNP89044.1 ATP-grasp domain-containing protein [Candidatus Woesebacteria bacterium]